MTKETTTLDMPLAQFEGNLTKTTRIIMDVFSNLESRKVFHGKTASEVKEVFNEELPKNPQKLENIIKEVEEKVIPYSTFNLSPYFNAYVVTCNNQAGMIGDMFAAFLSQNCGKWHLASSASEIEQIVIKWIKEYLGLEVNSGGIIVSGGSMANLTCLTVARRAMIDPDKFNDGLFGLKPMIIYTSTEIHHCVDKAIDMLGIGRNNHRKIPVNSNYEMDIQILEEQIKGDLANDYVPFCVAASAGTVNTGAIDDFNAIAEICKKYNLWFHIDGAYGAPAAGTELVGGLFKGIEKADSVAIDPHKWFYVPLEAGCALFKNEKQAKAAFSDIPDYLAVDKSNGSGRVDYMEYGMQLSRGFKALKIWMTFKAYGTGMISRAIENDIIKTRHLSTLLKNDKNFDVLAEGPLSVICFRYNPKEKNYSDDELNMINEKLLNSIEKDGRTFIAGTKINGKTSLRSCFVNHRAELRHVDYIFKVIKELSCGID